jgi:hypothetical protein
VVEESNADELKAGAEVPYPEANVEVFGANGLLEPGVVLEKGLADDRANTGEGEMRFVCVAYDLSDVSDALFEQMLPTSPDEGELNKLD